MGKNKKRRIERSRNWADRWHTCVMWNGLESANRYFHNRLFMPDGSRRYSEIPESYPSL